MQNTYQKGTTKFVLFALPPNSKEEFAFYFLCSFVDRGLLISNQEYR